MNANHPVFSAGLGRATTLRAGCSAAAVAAAAVLASGAPPAGTGSFSTPALHGATAPGTVPGAHRVLRHLDRFLDHHPLIENDLRNQVSLIEENSYLHRNPSLAVFLQEHPDVPGALRTLPRHLLHRALLRQARVDLRWSQVSELDPFLDRQPDIERQLARSPELIQLGAFLTNHPTLREFLQQHQSLRAGFLSSSRSLASR